MIRNIGGIGKFVVSFIGFDVGDAVVIAGGVAVGELCSHHWFIEDASKTDTLACRSCWLNPVGIPAGSVNTWFAPMLIELLVYWSTNMTEPSITWTVVVPLETVTT